MPTRSKAPLKDATIKDLDDNGGVSRQPKSLILYIIAGVVAVVIVVGGIFFYLGSRPLVNQSYAEEVAFSVYSPRSNPSGYNIDTDRVNSSSVAFSYLFNEVDGEGELTVTIQPRPDNFDMSSLSEGGSLNSTATSNGVLYNLSADGLGQYMLDTGDSLVFIRSSKAIDTATVNSLAEDLVKIN